MQEKRITYQIVLCSGERICWVCFLLKFAVNINNVILIGKTKSTMMMMTTMAIMMKEI